MWQHRYFKSTQDHWSARPDLPKQSTFAQTIQFINLLTDTLSIPKKISFAILGFQSDEGVIRNYGQPGAIRGPDAIRDCLAKLALHRSDIACFDVGNIACLDGNLEASQAALGETIAMLLKAKFIPLVLGGGHEVAFGHYQGMAKIHDKFSIVNFDAHFDMRPLRDNLGSSGTPFLQIANACKAQKKPFHYYCVGIQNGSNIPLLFETAKQFNVQYLQADTLHLQGLRKAKALLKKASHERAIYTSICLDVFANAFAPGVSAPQPLGLTPWQVIPLLRQLAMTGRVKSYDIAELAPDRDNNKITAKLAAYLLYEIIHAQVNKKGE